MAMRWRTYSPQFSNIVVPVPPRGEQDQIVRFLDWKVSSINKLISNYRHQIALLDEMKQQRIDEAVVKGLHERSFVHNDDIRWDIDYPEHWQIRRIRESFSFRKILKEAIGAKHGSSVAGVAVPSEVLHWWFGQACLWRAIAVG